jgi:hypothetical protein
MFCRDLKVCSYDKLECDLKLYWNWDIKDCETCKRNFFALTDEEIRTLADNMKKEWNNGHWDDSGDKDDNYDADYIEEYEDGYECPFCGQIIDLDGTCGC